LCRSVPFRFGAAAEPVENEEHEERCIHELDSRLALRAGCAPEEIPAAPGRAEVERRTLS
jgi:hypothetical protein